MNTFEKNLSVLFELDVEGKKAQVFASNIEELKIDCHPYGYEAVVHFTTFDDDEINQLFAEEKVMKASLTFKSNEGAPLLELKGIVGERSYTPKGKGVQKKPIRLYNIRFTDPAKMSWSYHFPMKIFVDQTMKDVIDAEKNPLISIKYDWDVLMEVNPIIAFSLDFKNGLPYSKQVNFYSFLTWYLHQFNGILEYDYKENGYSILGKKSEKGEPLPIAEWDITPAICQFPEPPRYQERVIEHSPKEMTPTDIDNPNGFQSVRKDGFNESTYHRFPEQISQTIRSKPFPEKPTINFYLKDFSDLFNLEHLVPGNLIEIKEDEKNGGIWCEDPAFKDQTFRITHISLNAKNNLSEGYKRPFQAYQLQIQIFAESKDETYVPRPEFKDPVYPFSIPGKIFSELGETEQTTFDVVKDENNTSLGWYRVRVPLAGADKNIVVPMTPDFISGQHYFPFCKDQQVMLSMYFQTARIERILDWQPLARLPFDTQANQIVFASNGLHKSVKQMHEYQNGNDSVFIIQQSSSEEQKQTVQIKEKELTITVEEKGKNTVSIQLHRESGLTLQLIDNGSGVTQQSVYNSTSITHTSEGGDGKSTIIQKPDSISIECKEYNVKCDNAIIEAKKTITHKATNKIFVEAPVVNIKDIVKMGG